MKIYTSDIQCQSRSDRHSCEREAVNRLVIQAFGTEAELCHNADGKPYINGRPEVHISISHSIDQCLLAVSDTPIGIDSETARTQLGRIANRFLTPNEIARGPHTMSELLKMWTAKEAVFKCASVSDLVISEIEVSATMDYASARGIRYAVRFITDTPERVTALASII